MFFNRNTSKQAGLPSPVAQRLAEETRKLQHKWAAFMLQKTQHWGRKAKVVFFLFICLLFGGSSLTILVRSLLNEGKPMTTTNFPARGPAIKAEPLYLPRAPVAGSVDTLLFRRFHRLTDSLRQSAEGRAQLEQYLRRNPGLMDSLKYVEKIMQ